METCLVLSARRYNFQDERGGLVQGVALTYLTDDVDTEGDRRGSAPLSINAPFDLWDSLKDLPALYDMDFKQRPGPKGKPTLQCVSLKFRAKANNLFGNTLP